VEIKYSTQTRAYEAALQAVQENLEGKYPEIEVVTSKSPDKDKFEVLLKRKEDDQEIISYSKQILQDPLPTKKNIFKFEEKFNKAIIELTLLKKKEKELKDDSKIIVDDQSKPQGSQVGSLHELAKASQETELTATQEDKDKPAISTGTNTTPEKFLQSDMKPEGQTEPATTDVIATS